MKYMKLNKLLFILFLINYNSVFANETKKEYLFISFFCKYSADRHFSEVDFGSPFVDYKYNKETDKEEPVFYTREECANKLREELLHNVAFVSEYDEDDYYTYIGGGLYRLEIGYYRYICVKYEDVKKTFPRERQDILDYDKFYNKYSSKVPLKVDENNLQVFNNIFPLNKNEEESIKFTKKFDEKVKKEIKKGIIESKEEQRIEREEKMREKEKKVNSEK